MSLQSYIKKIIDRGNRQLHDFLNLLKIIEKNIGMDPRHYTLLVEEWDRSMRKTYAVLLEIDPSGKNKFDNQLIDQCLNQMESTKAAIDNSRMQIHDELGSLNRNNIGGNLRYNRYRISLAKPEFVDLLS